MMLKDFFQLQIKHAIILKKKKENGSILLPRKKEKMITRIVLPSYESYVLVMETMNEKERNNKLKKNWYKRGQKGKKLNN